MVQHTFKPWGTYALISCLYLLTGGTVSTRITVAQVNLQITVVRYILTCKIIPLLILSIVLQAFHIENQKITLYYTTFNN